MAERLELVLGAINIVASPHPPGIYVDLLNRVSEIEIQIWGNDYAKITKPRQHRADENIYYGRVLVWTHIRKEGSWIDKKKNDKASDEDKKDISIPNQLEPNFRSFHYALNVKKHRIVIEYQNDAGEKFGPTRVLKLFTQLLSFSVLGDDAPDVRVTIVPEERSIERILKMPFLRKLEIHLERPNPDDLAEDTARILENMEKEGVKAETISKTKAPGVKSLKPSEETRILAEVAAENGYVVGIGRDGEGNSLNESTRNYPKKISVLLQKGQASISTFLSSVGIL